MVKKMGPMEKNGINGVGDGTSLWHDPHGKILTECFSTPGSFQDIRTFVLFLQVPGKSVCDYS